SGDAVGDAGPNNRRPIHWRTRVKIDLTGQFFHARQFLPGRLLVNGMEILRLTRQRARASPQERARSNEGTPLCVTMISAAATTSRTVATKAAASVAVSACRWAAAVSASAPSSCSA